jgi:CBS domain-containing protein
MKVKEIMTAPVVTVKAEQTLEEAAQLMLDKHVGGIPVVDDEGKVIGMVTESDYSAKEHAIPFSRIYAPQLFGEWMSKEGIEKAYEAARNITVDKIMTSPVITISPEDTLAEAVRKMLERRIHRVVAAEDGVPVGIVSRHDLLKLVVSHIEA